MKHLSRYSLACALLLLLSPGAGVRNAFAQNAPDAQAKAEASLKEVLPVTIFRNLQAGQTQTVVVYGTSLTIHGEWAKELKAYFDAHFPNQVTFVNSAKAGMQSRWGVANLQTRVLDKKPDLVFIEFAMNDASKNNKISLEMAQANLDSMVKALREQNPQVDIVLQTMNAVWDSPLTAPKKYGSDRPTLATYYDVYRRYAREQNLSLVDNYPAWFALQQQSMEKYREMVPDGIHPNPMSSQAVTWSAIQSLLEKARAAASNAPLEKTRAAASAASRAGDAAKTPTETLTFVVKDGALPWYDRTKGSNVWALDSVPESLKGTGPLPQQNCGNRTLEVPNTPKAVTIGVSNQDLERFKAKYPPATETGEDITIKNPKGRKIRYRVLTFPNPPAQIGEAGGFEGGLLLLKVEATSAGSKANQSLPPALPAKATTTPKAAQESDPMRPSATLTAPVANANVAPSVILPAKTNFHIYLLMGQSNMVGRDTRSLDPQASGNPHVLALNGEGQWVVAKDPLHEDKKLPVGVGLGLSFALEMAKADPSITIGLVPCAVGGTYLRRWVKGGDLYDRAVNRAKAASQVGIIKGVLWHQGEAETSNKLNADTYESRLTQMFKDLRADLGSPNLPIVVGQLGEFLDPKKHIYVESVRSAIKQVSVSGTNVGFADSEGLGDKGDKVHFSAEAERTLGVRYAQAMQKLQKANGNVDTDGTK